MKQIEIWTKYFVEEPISFQTRLTEFQNLLSVYQTEPTAFSGVNTSTYLTLAFLKLYFFINFHVCFYIFTNSTIFIVQPITLSAYCTAVRAKRACGATSIYIYLTILYSNKKG